MDRSNAIAEPIRKNKLAKFSQPIRKRDILNKFANILIENIITLSLNFISLASQELAENHACPSSLSQLEIWSYYLKTYVEPLETEDSTEQS